MSWYNYYGMIMLTIIMIPNIVYSFKCKEGFINLWNNKPVQIFEQIGRFGCFGLMMFNIPYTWFGFWFDEGLITYLSINGILIAAYCLVWIFCFRKNTIFRTLSLSILPSLIFLFSGIMIRSIPLIITAVIFAPSHITISLKNTLLFLKQEKL